MLFCYSSPSSSSSSSQTNWWWLRKIKRLQEHRTTRRKRCESWRDKMVMCKWSYRSSFKLTELIITSHDSKTWYFVNLSVRMCRQTKAILRTCLIVWTTTQVAANISAGVCMSVLLSQQNLASTTVWVRCFIHQLISPMHQTWTLWCKSDASVKSTGE